MINRDIWRGIFAALAVVSAGNLNVVCISSWYLLVYGFRVAYCRAILFLRTGGNLFCELFLNIYPCFSCVSIFILWLLNYNSFLSVSAVPVGASDRPAELLNRTWWRG